MKKYIAGIFTGLCIIPVLEELTTLALSWIEVAKIAPTRRTLKGNKDLMELQIEETEETSCIGFQYESPEECIYED